MDALRLISFQNPNALPQLLRTVKRRNSKAKQDVRLQIPAEKMFFLSRNIEWGRGKRKKFFAFIDAHLTCHGIDKHKKVCKRCNHDEIGHACLVSLFVYIQTALFSLLQVFSSFSQLGKRFFLRSLLPEKNHLQLFRE